MLSQALWRGDLSPLGCAAVANPVHKVQESLRLEFLGPLRSPAGINPLATGHHHAQTGLLPVPIFAFAVTVIYENRAVSQPPATLSLPAPNSTRQARRFSRCPTVWVLPAHSFCPH